MSSEGPTRFAVLRDPWVRFALFVWLALSVMSVGRAALANHPRHAGCYDIFQSAGRHWLAGEDLYNKVDLTSLVVFRNAPPVAAMFTPLGLLPTVAGNGLLRAVNLTVFLFGLWRWQQVAFPGGLTARQRAVFFLLVAMVGNNYLMDVQINVLTAGLLLLTTAGAIAGRWWEAAVAVGLAVALKGYPVSLALVFCVLAPRRFAWRYAVAQAAWFALPFALQNPSYVARQYQDWVEYGLNMRFEYGWFKDAMYLAGRFGWDMTRAEYVRWEIAAAAAVGLLCVLHFLRRPGRTGWNTAYALCLGWMLAFGPAAEQVTYIQAAPAVAGAAFLVWLRPQPLPFRVLIGLAVILLSGTQFELLFPGPHNFQIYGAHPAALLLFTLAVGVYGFGCGPDEARGTARIAAPAVTQRAA